MGLETSPEIKMAKRLHRKYSLSIPVDLDDLTSKFAEVVYKQIPIEGVDGVCLNLKHPNKKTKVIVNTSTSKNRQRFTLAHELGHIIIPWHLGTIVDELNPNQANFKYWTVESEANRFASELLMPFDWIYSRIENKSFKYNHVVRDIQKNCEVSEEAAKIRVNRFWDELIYHEISPEYILTLYSRYSDLAQIHQILTENSRFYPEDVAHHIVNQLDGKIAFVVEKDNNVITSGATQGTRYTPQYQGNTFEADPYPYFKNYSLYKNEYSNTHWWDLDVKYSTDSDDRSWREILDRIVHELYSAEDVKAKKHSINASVSSINGTWKHKFQDRSVEQFIQEILDRFNTFEHKQLIQHPDFALYVRKRSVELFNNRQNTQN